MSLNKVMLIGNVGKIDARSVNDSRVVTMSLATTERYKNKNGEVVEDTTWHSVVVWGKTAEFVEKYVTKGSQVYVEGKIQNRKYTDRDGNEKYVTEVKADSVQGLAKSSKSSESRATSARAPQGVDDDDPTSDLPF